ncbi:hypothetical protein DYB30_002462 [Aphanomyces astaci]|uniref:Aminotransferase class V domain-containing protein n=1 Tax=Aphanomyces astaci TaxID=112090 RepID=A0A397DBE1_APHAT|nr:hypothetical protein DYB30_002462 [Aphanomyces astaci]
MFRRINALPLSYSEYGSPNQLSSRVGNYVLQIEAPNAGPWGPEGKALLRLYFLDSEDGQFTNEQQTYVKGVAAQLAHQQVPALMFIHNPIPEYAEFDQQLSAKQQLRQDIMTVTEKKTLCMNPGPIAFEKDVLDAFAHEGISHVDPYFIDVFLAQDGQPLVVTGSGTLGWDMVASNLLEAGDDVLVINTGRPFIPSFLLCLPYLMTYLGVADYTAAIRAAQPDALVIVDSVCALGGEELRMKAWDVDVVLTGSQKCLGVPAGLSILVIRPRALKVHEKLSAAKPKYYCDWTNWLAIMKNYEARRPSYFATPAVNHVPIEGVAANTMTCVRFPKGISGPDLLPKVYARGVSLAGGLHKDIKTEYFRIGHMGPSTRRADHAIQTVAAIEAALIECGYAIPAPGQAVQGLKAALKGKIPLEAGGTKADCGCCIVPVKCQFLTLGIVALSFGVGYLLSGRRR